MEILGGWDRVRRNLVGTFFLQTKARALETKIAQPPSVILHRQTNWLPSTEVEREHRHLTQLDTELEDARAVSTKKQREFELRWKLIAEKVDLFQSVVASFDNYYMISKLKQESDERVRISHERDLLEVTREVNRLKKTCRKLKQVKQGLKRRLQISEGFRDFMQKVVKESNGEYEEISQVIARYYELRDIRENYVEKTVEQVKKAFQLQNELRELQQISKMQEVAGSTYLSQLKSYQDQLKTSTWRRQDNLVAVKDGLRHELLTTFVPKMALHSLYLILCQEMKQPVEFTENQFREQLEFIQKFIKELVKLSARTTQELACPSTFPFPSLP